MSDCTVCRLESVCVIGGFRVRYCSSSIYLYIGDVVLRVVVFYRVVIRIVYFCYLLNGNSLG